MPAGKARPIASERSLHQQRRDIDVLAEEALRNDAFGIDVAGPSVTYGSLSQRHAAHGLIVYQRVQPHE
jgi:hypothetical protein